MARRNYTREILAKVREGRVPVTSVGPDTPIDPARVVDYAPRSKNDPQPWTNGTFRYNGREIYTLARCARPLLRISGEMTKCGLPVGHKLACRSMRSNIRYTIA